MKHVLALIFSLFTLVAFSQYEYNVLKTSRKIHIDGLSKESTWDKAIELTTFRNYWSDNEMPKTSFKGLYDDNFFYFLYNVIDNDIVLVDKPSIGEENQAVGSDRIEIFIRNEDTSKDYYSLEMDAKARVFDSKADFNKSYGVDSAWDWPEGQLELKSTFTDNGYIVEGRISMTSLKELDLFDGNVLYAGLYRGNYSSRAGKKPSVDWISWVKPKKLNFHIPSSFGVLKFME
ncbi:carbohydrate-binding family 9-like protein [Flavivirga spongiicola]|uniref:Carbohydrate-binding family 9-like protein n=1 Tax=Flavivirga spongiicola TaxID=421621 RepID=A0ABU7XP66_9FLAO|nr:carbohydrate-binding family 9-like protein [Flavivirga sp. MEBiC05379]MDO5981378.1 carbohydrate-binding family 9-like protein [Flavivirga sp. MEBiC05379]